MAKGKTSETRMEVAPWVDALGGFIARRRRLWVSLGRLESRLLAGRLAQVELRSPIYVCGLARAGSTILLEILAGHALTASHCYRDYPPIYTPFWWNRYLDRVPRPEETPSERAHKDRILVTSESPEAMEEVLWMTFFPSSHDPGVSQVLDRETQNPAFESFYRSHLKKLLLVRGGNRYLAKGNYNVTRLEYLLKLFPDARFVLPVRAPLAQVASLVKQHELFCRAQKENRKALDHMVRVGHFEFGLERRPINTGNQDLLSRTIDLWQQGRQAEGYALQWAAIYNHVADLLAENDLLRRAALLLRYEDLCADPQGQLERLFAHLRLEGAGDLIAAWAERISPPAYYQPQFSPAQSEFITRETAETAGRLGYQAD